MLLNTPHLCREDDHVWYLPHHGVYNKKKLKLRVVFDCTSCYQGTSLNKELLQGPDLTNTLIGVLLRVRKEKVTVIADIEAMSYQVYVSEHHRDCLMFLWWPEGDIGREPKVHRMRVHLFGASPSMANFALHQTVEDNKDKYEKLVIKTINDNFYVDDCLKSVPTESQAIPLCRDLEDACKQGGFTLTKWVSNSNAVIETIPESHRAAVVKELELDRDSLKEPHPVERAFGIHWELKKDIFTFKVALKNRPATKRAIFSTASSVYDPVGFLAPFVLKAKQILQELCKSKCRWDQIIPDEFSKSWQRWCHELNELDGFHVHRCP